MRSISFHIAARPGFRDIVDGFIVDGTCGVMAIDLRHDDAESIWVITHLPTGMRVKKHPYTIANSQQQAAAVAKEFFDQAVKAGMPMDSNDSEAISSSHNAMSMTQGQQFWEQVRRAGAKFAMQTDREVLKACEGVFMALQNGVMLSEPAVSGMLQLIRERLKVPPEVAPECQR